LTGKVLVDSVVYLVRSPQEMISPFLYPKTKNATLIAIKKGPLPGRVVHSVSDCSTEEGTPLSYSELLELLLESRRIVAL
jgi:hypothetical protein